MQLRVLEAMADMQVCVREALLGVCWRGCARQARSSSGRDAEV